MSGDELAALFSGVHTFEFRVETSAYTLPADALVQLRSFAELIKK